MTQLPRNPAPAHADLIAFVLREARLLDEQHWEAWNALFSPEGWYWLPASAKNTDPLGQVSHLYDDRLLREVRLARIRSPQAYSQQPAGQCHHLLQQPEVIESDGAGNRHVLRTSFIYTELRAGRTISLPGVAWHHLQYNDGQLRILLKRVDLLHAGEPMTAVEFYI